MSIKVIRLIKCCCFFALNIKNKWELSNSNAIEKRKFELLILDGKTVCMKFCVAFFFFFGGGDISPRWFKPRDNAI